VGAKEETALGRDTVSSPGLDGNSTRQTTPGTPGEYTLTCAIDDWATPATGVTDTGTRDDATVMVERDTVPFDGFLKCSEAQAPEFLDSMRLLRPTNNLLCRPLLQLIQSRAR
jgi:hypothetical protein